MNFNIIYPKITLNRVNKYSQEKLNEFKSKVDKTWSEAHAVYMGYNDKYMACVGWGVLAAMSLAFLLTTALVGLIYPDMSKYHILPIVSSITFILCTIHVFFAIKKILYNREMNTKIEQSLDTILKILADYSIYPVLDEDTAWRSIIREQIEMREAYFDDLDAWKIVLWSKGAEYYDETLKNIETLQQIGLNNIIYSNISITNDYELFCPCAVLTETLNNYTLTRYNLYLSKVYEDLGSAKNVIRTVLEKPNEVNIDLGYLDDVFAKCNKSDGFTPNITEESRRICAEILTRI